MERLVGRNQVEPDVAVLTPPREGRGVGSIEIDIQQGQHRPPRRPDGRGVPASLAFADSQTVTSPRWTSARSSSGQCSTWSCVLYFGWTRDFMPTIVFVRASRFQENRRGGPEERHSRTNAPRGHGAVDHGPHRAPDPEPDDGPHHQNEVECPLDVGHPETGPSESAGCVSSKGRSVASSPGAPSPQVSSGVGSRRLRVPVAWAIMRLSSPVDPGDRAHRCG